MALGIYPGMSSENSSKNCSILLLSCIQKFRQKIFQDSVSKLVMNIPGFPCCHFSDFIQEIHRIYLGTPRWNSSCFFSQNTSRKFYRNSSECFFWKVRSGISMRHPLGILSGTHPKFSYKSFFGILPKNYQQISPAFL